MANLQYIGARYVPKFYENPDDQSNDWKLGVMYEPLTIVTYNNDSYTSKEPVPDTVGDPASNPKYWACTTRYTASLVSLQNSVGTLEAFVGDGPLDTEADTLGGAVNELKYDVDDVALRSLINNVDIQGKFIGGYFSSSQYANALCFDGDHFYATTSNLNATNEAKLLKINKTGDVSASLNIGYYHANTAVCDDNFIYVLLDSGTILVVTKDFSSQTPISTGVMAKGLGYSEGKYYVITDTKVIEYDNAFVSPVAEFNYQWFNDGYTFQTAKIYKNLMFACGMFPNTIFVYDYVEQLLLAQLTVGPVIDGVRIGEIEDVVPIDIDGKFNLFIQGSSIINSNKNYNKICILAGDFTQYAQKQGPRNSYYDCVYHVDGLSVAAESLGTDDAPFKSLIECLENTYYSSNCYHIYVDNINPTIDSLTALYRVHPINAVIEFNGTIPTDNYIRYINSQLEMILKGSTNGSLALESCTASIDTSSYTGNLTLSNRSSLISVIGDLYSSVNVNGVTNVSGTLRKDDSTATMYGLTNAKKITRYSNAAAQPLSIVGNGLRYQKTAVLNSNGTFNISGNILCGILTFSSNVNSNYNRSYFISGYGAGGSGRTKFGLMPDNTSDSSEITPALGTGNSLDFTITNLAEGAHVRVTYTAMGYSPQDSDDVIDVTFTFT